jgi:hypothetical protein
MTAVRVVPTFDELEDRHACLDLGFEAAAFAKSGRLRHA